MLFNKSGTIFLLVSVAPLPYLQAGYGVLAPLPYRCSIVRFAVVLLRRARVLAGYGVILQPGACEDRHEIWGYVCIVYETVQTALRESMADEPVKVLSRYFKPDFVRLAVNLPPSSTFWSTVEGEIEQRAYGDVYTQEQLLNFLAIFFTSSVVQQVEEKLEYLSSSSLGFAYTLRKGHHELAKAILADIHEHPALKHFNGGVSLASHGVFSGEPSPSSGAPIPRASEGGQNNEASSGKSEGWRGRSGATGGGGRVVDDDADDSAGSGGDDGSNRRRDHFPTMDENIVVIPMSAFSTPPKGDFDRSLTLKARSLDFITHANLSGDLTNVTRIYDPFNSQKGRILLYHGTRTSSLASFKLGGISPRLSRNEFSVLHAFYVSNSIRQAFEHPLHKHVSGDTVDPVSILVFEVDVAALHGEKLPIGETSNFTCRWFAANTPSRLKAWSDFCANNMSSTGSPHSYDVVIGPVCYLLEAGGYEKLYTAMLNSIPLTQVALCTPRARAWLQRCFKRVYMEKRSSGAQL